MIYSIYIYPIKSPFKNGPLSRSTSWSPGGRWPKCKAPPRCRRAPNPGENPWWPDPPEPWEILGYPWLSDIFSQSFPLWHGRIDDSNGFNGFNDEIGSIIFFDRFKTSPVWRFHRPIIEACAKLHGTNMDRDRWHFGVSPCVYHTGG